MADASRDPPIQDYETELSIRLREAFNVIQPEVAQSKKEGAEKKARTTYRDDFNTRPGTNIRYSSWYHGDSDNDGEEYDPNQSSKKKAKPINETKKKRLAVDTAGDRKRQKRKSGHEALPNSIHQPFLTLNVTSDTGKNLLAKLAVEYQEYLEKVSTARESQQKLNNAVPSSGLEDEDSTKTPRSLRNGKILESPIVLKRKENKNKEVATSSTKRDKGKAVIRSNERRSLNDELVPGDRQGVPVYADEWARAKNDPMNATVSDWEKLDDPDADEDGDAEENADSAKSSGSAPQTGQNQATAIYITDSESDESKKGPTNDRGRPSTLEHNSSRQSFNPKAPRTTYITTAFAHPINFQAVSSCDFCSDYRFGMLGYGLIEIRVRYSRRDRTDFIELGGGHAEDHAPTQMCFNCAAGRLQITRCKDHKFELTKIRSYAGDLHRRYTEQFAEWDYIIHNHGKRSNQEPIVPSCSICINPAMWECCAYQSRDRVLKPCRLPDIPLKLQRQQLAKEYPGQEIVLQGPVKGCGLKLCFQCHLSVRDKGFDLEDEDEVMATILAHNNSVHFRADLQFLFKTGSVWIKYVL